MFYAVHLVRYALLLRVPTRRNSRATVYSAAPCRNCVFSNTPRLSRVRSVIFSDINDDLTRTETDTLGSIRPVTSVIRYYFVVPVIVCCAFLAGFWRRFPPMTSPAIISSDGRDHDTITLHPFRYLSIPSSSSSYTVTEKYSSAAAGALRFNWLLKISYDFTSFSFFGLCKKEKKKKKKKQKNSLFAGKFRKSSCEVSTTNTMNGFIGTQ